MDFDFSMINWRSIEDLGRDLVAGAPLAPKSRRALPGKAGSFPGASLFAAHVVMNSGPLRNSG
jgi:hypothetical protein